MAAHAAAEVREHRLAQTVREEGLPAFPGVLDLIHAALGRRVSIVHRDLGDPRAVRGDSDRCEGALRADGLRQRQRRHEEKPDPQIFLIAIGRLGLPAAVASSSRTPPAGPGRKGRRRKSASP